MNVERISGILIYLVCSAISQEIIFGGSISSQLCLTPFGERGWCTYVGKCSHAIHMIREGGKPTICRFNGTVPEVCCTNPKGPAELRGNLDGLEIEAPQNAPREECGIRFPKPRLRTFGDSYKAFGVGGLPAPKHSWPWMVLLGRRRGQRNDYFCGGAILNEHYVITAAHCILSLEPFFVRVGEHDHGLPSNSRKDIDVVNVTFHPKYDLRKGYHDIAVLKLAKSITYRKEVKPICLPWGKLVNEDLINRPVTLAGWGKLGFSAATSSVLQEVNVTVFHPSICSKSYSALPDYATTFPDGMNSRNILCAGHIDGGKDSCDGDSGGPLMHYEAREGRYSLVAVISKGFGCGKKDFPGLNAPIRNHETLQWIKSVAF